MSDDTALAVREQNSIARPHNSVFADNSAWGIALEQARALADSNVVPETFRKNHANCIVALELAHRCGVSPLMVMQNLHIIQGRPSWAAAFVIALLNSSGRFSPLRFEYSGRGDDAGCVARAVYRATGEDLVGERITMAMAKAEGWLTRSGSKWKTMPRQMLAYRAAAFFARLYAPDLLMGMHSAEEMVDIQPSAQGLRREAVEAFNAEFEDDTPSPAAEEPTMTPKLVQDAIRGAKTLDELERAGALIAKTPANCHGVLEAMEADKRAELES